MAHGLDKISPRIAISVVKRARAGQKIFIY